MKLLQKDSKLSSSETLPGNLEVILDQDQILRDLDKIMKPEDYHYDNKNFQVKLSSETCLQIRLLEKKSLTLGTTSLFQNPFRQVVIPLSKFLNSIIPNIRIPFIYHADLKSIDIIPHLYLNDGSVNFKPERICQDFASMFQKQTDCYFEAVIPTDAYLIWDASRKEMQSKLWNFGGLKEEKEIQFKPFDLVGFCQPH